jgi:hypothetical protein
MNDFFSVFIVTVFLAVVKVFTKIYIKVRVSGPAAGVWPPAETALLPDLPAFCPLRQATHTAPNSSK